MTNHINIFPGDFITFGGNNHSYFVLGVSRLWIKLINIKTGEIKIIHSEDKDIRHSTLQKGIFNTTSKIEICEVCPVKELLGECNPVCKYLDKTNNPQLLNKNIGNIGVCLRISKKDRYTSELFMEFDHEYCSNAKNNYNHSFDLFINDTYLLDQKQTEDFLTWCDGKVNPKNLVFDFLYTKLYGKPIRVSEKDYPKVSKKIFNSDILDQILYLCDGCIMSTCDKCFLDDLRRDL